MRVLDAPKESAEMRELLDQVRSEPLMIRRDGTEPVVLVSAKIFERMRIEDDFDAICERLAEQARASGLTEEKLTEILNEIDAEDRV